MASAAEHAGAQKLEVHPQPANFDTATHEANAAACGRSS